MSTNESPEQTHVVVLHSARPLEVDPSDTYPEHRITVLTDGPPVEVAKDLERPDTVSMPRSEWHDQLVRWARGGPIEVVTFDEDCALICTELRATLGLDEGAPT
ncbi:MULTISPECIES: hypothetical protein [Nocardiopsis]|uniref:Uncharacterized protein n=1 Tax=Nocardiopsis alba TaxID=53437 RepID=A0A7K2IX82_9ACTN|nr:MULTISPECIES: hypothetical protein [Nocardiopsis]MEC3892045.1 hypothetical protein [Nocardiopsis sp. LDBS1602]MYR34581.1 hypothetical protein [Nocardiopsis alba]